MDDVVVKPTKNYNSALQEQKNLNRKVVKWYRMKNSMLLIDRRGEKIFVSLEKSLYKIGEAYDYDKNPLGLDLEMLEKSGM